MSRLQWASAAIFALGVVPLIVAPQAQWCVTDGDSAACETAGIIVLNVLGFVLLAGGVIALASASPRSRTR